MEMKTYRLLSIFIILSVTLSSCSKSCPGGFKTQDAFPVYDATVNYVISPYMQSLERAVLINEYISLKEEEKEAFEDKYFSTLKLRFRGDSCILLSNGVAHSYYIGVDKDLNASGTLWKIEYFSAINYSNTVLVKMDLTSLGNNQYSIYAEDNSTFSSNTKNLSVETMNLTVTLSDDEIVSSLTGYNYSFYGAGSYIERRSISTNVNSVKVGFSVSEDKGINSFIYSGTNVGALFRLFGGTLNMKVESISGYEPINDEINVIHTSLPENPFLTFEFRGVKEEIQYSSLPFYY